MDVLYVPASGVAMIKYRHYLNHPRERGPGDVELSRSQGRVVSRTVGGRRCGNSPVVREGPGQGRDWFPERSEVRGDDQVPSPAR